MSVDITEVLALVREQNDWRGGTVNLIASENTQSPAVRAIESSDLAARYAEGHPGRRYYQGTRIIDRIETMATEELMALARCRQADVRPISGNAANTAIALAYLRGGDAIIVNSTPAGGHISHNNIGVFGRRIQTRGMKLKLGVGTSIPMHFFPLAADGYHLDVAASIDLIRTVKPILIVLGKSLFLFPEPVAELAAVCQELGIAVLYDAAHVFGLIMGGKFQDPLREGATWMTASTHKTFPGPQRGVIVANLEGDDVAKFWNPADRGVFPGSSSNHHLQSLPALVVAIREMAEHAPAYAEQIVRNAKAFGQALHDQGIGVEAREFGFTETHQLALNVCAHGGGEAVAERLEQMGIIVNFNLLPGDSNPRNPSGLRIGVQEMTRFGMAEGDFGSLAVLMADAIKGKQVADAVRQFRLGFQTLGYN